MFKNQNRNKFLSELSHLVEPVEVYDVLPCPVATDLVVVRVVVDLEVAVQGDIAPLVDDEQLVAVAEPRDVLQPREPDGSGAEEVNQGDYVRGKNFLRISL